MKQIVITVDGKVIPTKYVDVNDKQNQLQLYIDHVQEAMEDAQKPEQTKKSEFELMMYKTYQLISMLAAEDFPRRTEIFEGKEMHPLPNDVEEDIGEALTYIRNNFLSPTLDYPEVMGRFVSNTFYRVEDGKVVYLKDVQDELT